VTAYSIYFQVPFISGFLLLLEVKKYLPEISWLVRDPGLLKEYIRILLKFKIATVG
jgi:hypothetical protein